MSIMAATSHLGGVSGSDWSKIPASIITPSAAMVTRRNMVLIMPRYELKKENYKRHHSFVSSLWVEIKTLPDKLHVPLTYKYSEALQLSQCRDPGWLEFLFGNKRGCADFFFCTIPLSWHALPQHLDPVKLNLVFMKSLWVCETYIFVLSLFMSGPSFFSSF